MFELFIWLLLILTCNLYLEMLSFHLVVKYNHIYVIKVHPNNLMNYIGISHNSHFKSFTFDT